MSRLLFPLGFLALSACGVPAQNDDASERPPLVYAVEHTGTEFPAPPLPALADLPAVAPLTDPFLWSDGSGRATRFEDWSRRRTEIKAEFEHYEIGRKPTRSEKISATYKEGNLTVSVTVNEETLTLDAAVSLPDGDGPFPAVIGIGFGPTPGSLPPDIFRDRKIAVVSFIFGQVMSHPQKRGQEPINKLYPDLTSMGTPNDARTSACCNRTNRTPRPYSPAPSFFIASRNPTISFGSARLR